MINNAAENRKKICIVATVPFVLRWFMTPHIQILSKEYKVTLVSNGTEKEVSDLLCENVTFIPLDIERKISVKKDISALIKLYRIFKINKFDCVHSITPKSGLLTMLAGKFACIPQRFHIFTGQVWANKKGISRFALKQIDKLLSFSSTKILADSHSQRLFLIENKVVNESKIEVLAEGSAAGVNINRFKFKADKRKELRIKNNIPVDSVVFLFLGRLTYDKGLMDLSESFESIASNHDSYHLLIVGPDEDGLENVFESLGKKFPGRIHRVGFTNSPENYMCVADIFCLPSYREGFGSAIIEAAAIGIPTIASRIYGISDAVEDGYTGILHEPGNISELTTAMLNLASNKGSRETMGKAANKRAVTKFSEQIVADAMLKFYQKCFS